MCRGAGGCGFRRRACTLGAGLMIFEWRWKNAFFINDIQNEISGRLDYLKDNRRNGDEENFEKNKKPKLHSFYSFHSIRVLLECT